ncbi:MAG: hypothetical protein HW421_721 [Ignavibacteria bacterium]|nr:hypothetical protein [Ignavibacteria bacterium]
MPINQIYPNPTVKQVIFQIRFPNLFSMENNIGDIQYKIMEEFPQSALIFKRQLLFLDTGEEGLFKGVQDEFEHKRDNKNAEQLGGKKIWQFKSNKNFQLNITADSLDITSQHHKTYQKDGADKFRDIIEFVLTKFFEVIKIPIINRVGLRYIDECPIPKKNNTTFKSYYNSVFPIDRFNLADAKEMVYRTVIKKGKNFLIYIESLSQIENQYKLILDFDGFAENIKSKDVLTTTDILHTIIEDEFVNTIREPVIKFMKQKKVG